MTAFENEPRHSLQSWNLSLVTVVHVTPTPSVVHINAAVNVVRIEIWSSEA